MFRPGSFVAQHVSPVEDEQVQPNGVDLTLSAVFEQRGTGFVGLDDTDIGDREQRRTADGKSYRLESGGYVVRYGETVSIPSGHVGFVYPRSSLLRNSCMLDTAVWDAGYEGRGEGLLEVYQSIAIEKGARIAQLVFAEADHHEEYDGTYQGENL